MSISDTDYFPSLQVDEIGAELMKRVDAYYENIWRSGRLQMWRRSRAQYNKSRQTLGRVLEHGKQGEYLEVNANHYASILSNQLSLITSQKIAWDPKASNTDFRSQTQTILAKGLLDYYVREKRLDSVLTRAAEFCALYGESGVLVAWDPLAGEVHAVDGVAVDGVAVDGVAVDGVAVDGMSGESAGPQDAGEAPAPMEEPMPIDDAGIPMDDVEKPPKPIFTGDISCAAYSPIDIIRDVASRVPLNDHPWVIVRKFQNKFELANKFEEYADEIKALSWTRDPVNHDYMDAAHFDTDYNQVDSDDVPMYSFYHEVTALMPEGRMVEFLTEELVLTDSPLPYADIPLKWIAYREEDERPYGYSSMWDLLPLQTVVDSLLSTMATNHKHFGLNILMVPRGQGWDISKATSGLSVIEVDPALPQSAAPQSISLLGNHQESMGFAASLVHDMETLSGVNSVARGNPEASLKSGAALALVQSMAIQSSQQLQKSYYRLLEDVGTTVISHLKTFADLPRVAEITGKSKRGVLTEFASKDLEFVNRVTVEAGSALSKTLAGRVNLAELLLQQGVLKTPEALMEVLETGNLEVVLEGDMAKIMLIRAENEALESGEYPVQAIITDNHMQHINEHCSVLASPSSRQDRGLVQRVLAHQQEHIMLLMDPNNAMLLASLGQQSMAAPPPPPGGAPPPADMGAAVGEAAPPNGEMPGMPNQPTNPLTGEQNPDGGLNG